MMGKGKSKQPLIERIDKIGREGVSFGIELSFAMMKLIILFLLLLGTASSFLLLKKLYPETWSRLVDLCIPIMSFLFTVTSIIIKVFAVWIVIYLLFVIFRTIKEAKKERDKRRDDFINELTDKLNKRNKK